MNIFFWLLMAIEPEVYLCNPVSTPYGIVFTNNYCNDLYLIAEGRLNEIYSGPGCGRYFALSYNKTKIGIKIISENGLQIPAIYDLKTHNVQKLHSPVYQAGQVSFSKNGKVAFTIGEELLVQNSNETKRYELGVYANLCPISPDGDFVVYNDNNDQLYLLNLADNNRICITDNKDGYCYPRWSPDSRFIAYSTLGGFIKIYDRIENRTYEIDEGRNFNWSTDSRYLIYHKIYADGHKLINSELFISKYDGSEKIQLTHTPEILEMDPSFIDSDKIIYHTFDKQEIYSAEIKDWSLQNIEILFKVQEPFNVNYYHILTNCSKRDSINVPFVHQVYDTPDWHNGHWSCGPTTAIMAIAYYKKLPYWDCWCSYPYGHTSHFGNYVCSQYNYREVTYNQVAQDPSGNNAWGGYGYMWSSGGSPYSRMRQYLINHGLNSWDDNTPTWQETLAEVQARYPYCICAGLTSAGHIVLAVGWVSTSQRTLIFNDPYGNKNTPGYPSYDGKYARYDWPGYNYGYQNLNQVHWCRGARGSWPAPVDTIVDDLQIRYPGESFGFYMFTNPPSTMRFYRDNLSGYNGHFWWTYTTASADTCYVTWTPRLNFAGNYEVLVYIPSINATANARYRVYYAGGNRTVTINQNNYSNQWVTLGTFPFNTTGGYVYLGDATGTPMQRIAFDAVRWRYVGQSVEENKPEFADKIFILNSIVKNTIELRFSILKNKKVKVSIFNSTGSLVYSITKNISADESIKKIDVSFIAPGVYFMNISDGNSIQKEKFIKIH